MASEPIGVVGLGIMGSRMAARLMAAGHQVVGYDADGDAAERFSAAGGSPAPSPVSVGDACAIVLLSLPTSEVSREVCLGTEGLLRSGRRPLLVLDTTTGRPSDAEEIGAALGRAGVAYADATVSGNAPLAEAGRLVVMCGGTEEAYRLAAPVFRVIGRSSHHVGPVGSGARVKLVVNHVLGIHRMALAEGLAVAELAGLDLDRTLKVLRDGAAYSTAMDLWGERMVAGDHDRPSARLRQSAKDARIIVEHGTALGSSMDLSRVVRAGFEEGMAGGLADLDNSAIAEVVRRRAGIGRVPSSPVRD